MTALPRDAAQLGGEGARDHGTALDRDGVTREMLTWALRVLA